MTNWGLARWAGVGADGFTREEAVQRMRAHPRFPDTMRQAVAGSLELLDNDPLMARAMKSMNRVVSGFLALYLDATGDLTLARIQQLCAELGMMSPGRAVAMLAHLRQLRYIELAAEQLDSRKRLYVPTAKMRQAFLGQLQKDLMAFALVEPEALEVADQFARPDVSRKLLIRFGERLIVSTRNYQTRDRTSDLFFERQAGLMILDALMQAGEPGDVFPPAGPIHFSIAGLARRFGVSRPHVRKLLRDAEHNGLLRRDGEDGPCLLEAALREQVMGYHARMFAGFAICAHAALAEARFEHRADTHDVAALGH